MTSLYDKFEGRIIDQDREDGNWYVVGDIHGNYDLLMEQLEEVRFDFDRDTLFSVGDLVDRGEKSWECLMLTYEPWFISVLGNHEGLMYDALTKGQSHLWIQNGGGWFYDEWRDKSPCDRSEALSIIMDMPNYLTLRLRSGKSVGVIHASANGKVWPPKQTSLDSWSDDTIWDRTCMYGVVPKVRYVDLVVAGHSPFDKPTLQNNTLHIDSLYKTGKLSILNVEEIVDEC